MEEENNNDEEDKKYPQHIKLKKTPKGYTWEIKVFLDDEKQDNNILKRIKNIDENLKKDYPK